MWKYFDSPATLDSPPSLDLYSSPWTIQLPITMRFALVPFFSLALASPILSKSAETFKPIYCLLAGDSTTAPNGGWGDAFLSTTVAPESSGHNYGHGGASTASFRAGGDWANVISDIRANKDEYDVFVTIQACL